MIIVLSPNIQLEKESYWVNTLLDNALNFFHIRKYTFTDLEIKRYIQSIDSNYRKKLVLHSHYHLAAELGIERLHLSEKNRAQIEVQCLNKSFKYSTSVHSIEHFNQLSNIWEYAFLSPVFQSISKPGYGIYNNVLKNLSARTNNTVQLIGLGGINETNAQIVKEHGANGIGLLGAIWQAKNPLKMYLQCKEKDLLY